MHAKITDHCQWWKAIVAKLPTLTLTWHHHNDCEKYHNGLPFFGQFFRLHSLFSVQDWISFYNGGRMLKKNTGVHGVVAGFSSSDNKRQIGWADMLLPRLKRQSGSRTVFYHPQQEDGWVNAPHGRYWSQGQRKTLSLPEVIGSNVILAPDDPTGNTYCCIPEKINPDIVVQLISITSQEISIPENSLCTKCDNISYVIT